MIQILFVLAIICNANMLFSEEKSEALVVYYSRDGHTKTVAEKISVKFKADIERLIDKKKRTGFLENILAGTDAISGASTTLEKLNHNPADYDIILVGTPSWFSNMTPAVRTFLDSYDLLDKKVGFFATCHSSGADKTVKQMAENVSKDKAADYPVLFLKEKDLEEQVLEKKIEEFYRKFNQR